MQAKRFNRTPTQEEVFKEMHTRKSDKATWVDSRSNATYVISKLSTSLALVIYTIMQLKYLFQLIVGLVLAEN